MFPCRRKEFNWLSHAAFSFCDCCINTGHRAVAHPPVRRLWNMEVTVVKLQWRWRLVKVHFTVWLIAVRQDASRPQRHTAHQEFLSDTWVSESLVQTLTKVTASFCPAKASRHLRLSPDSRCRKRAVIFSVSKHREHVPEQTWSSKAQLKIKVNGEPFRDDKQNVNFPLCIS